MSKPVPRRTGKRVAPDGALRTRQLQRKALRAQLREERDIQRLTRQLNHAIQRTHDRYQELAAVLGSHARAIEAERESSLAING